VPASQESFARAALSTTNNHLNNLCFFLHNKVAGTFSETIMWPVGRLTLSLSGPVGRVFGTSICSKSSACKSYSSMRARISETHGTLLATLDAMLAPRSLYTSLATPTCGRTGPSQSSFKKLNRMKDQCHGRCLSIVAPLIGLHWIDDHPLPPSVQGAEKCEKSIDTSPRTPNAKASTLI
jgi:hypothetical protein